MAECVHTWRKKLRLQKLIIIARKELESGKDVSQVYQILEEQMSIRWRLSKPLKSNILMM